MILVDCALVRVVHTFFFIIISITATNLFARLFYLSLTCESQPAREDVWPAVVLWPDARHE